MKQFIKCPECGKVHLSDCNLTIIYCGCSCRIVSTECEPLKALSIKQPWSWLIINGYKDIENRNTLKNFRGTFLIHAGLNSDFDNFHDHINKEEMQIPSDYPYKFNTGGIIGYAEIYNSVTKSDSPWFVGKNGLMIRNPKPLPFTPCKGKLSFFYPEID